MTKLLGEVAMQFEEYTLNEIKLSCDYGSRVYCHFFRAFIVLINLIPEVVALFLL